MPLGMGDSEKRYKDLTRTNAKFFGGGSLVNPDAPSQIWKKAKSFANDTASKGGKSKRKKRRKKTKKK